MGRALTAVAVVNAAIEKIDAAGELREFNRVFKKARKADPNIFDYLEAQKATMLGKRGELICKGASAS